MNRTCSLAVIGAGPAGMAAARAARDAGADVTVIDDNAAAGGQAYRDLQANAASRPGAMTVLGDDYGQGRALLERFQSCGATIMTGAGVWSVEPGGTVHVVDHAGVGQVQARRVIIAAGAMERPVPIPGWTLPGVITLGAAQTVLKSPGLVPDGRTVIAGCGPLLYLAAMQLLDAGADIAAILDTTRPGHRRAALAHLPGTLLNAAPLRKGLKWRRALKRSGVPFIPDAYGIRAHGTEALETVVYGTGGQHQTVAADTLLLHAGIVPSHHLAALAGCRLQWDGMQAAWHTVADDWGATTVDTIGVAGDCAAIGGAELAVQSGRLAGLDAAYRLGFLDRAARDRAGSSVLRMIRRQRPLRRFLDSYFRPPDEFLMPPDDDTIVCRCEDVTAGAVRQAAALGAPGPNQTKAFTRAGMGPCQGRMCAATVAHLIAEVQNRPVSGIDPLRARPPLKPLTVGQMAASAE